MRRYLTTLAALLVALAACGPQAPASPSVVASQAPSPSAVAVVPSPTSVPTIGPSPTPADPDAVYGLVASQVEAIRGLKPTGNVKPVLIDQPTLAANLAKDFDSSNPAQVVANSQRELIVLGLLPAGSSLRAAVLDLDSGQVAGYYSPEAKQLFVVSRAGGIGPTQRLTYAHEFTHQLQDQNFSLKSLDLNATDQGDRSLAHLSLVEGDAVSVQDAWMVNLTSQELTQVLADSLDPNGVAALNRAPFVLQQTSLFPYTAGLAFVQSLLTQGGYSAVNAAFSNPPASTEQVLHVDKYLGHELPVTMTPASNLAASLGTGWSELARDTLGEFQLRIWLQAGGVDQATATSAAAGWGGDRLVLLGGPDGQTAVAIETAWDTADDATEFAASAETAIAHLHLSGAVVHADGSTKVSVAVAPDVKSLAEVLPG